MSEGSAHGLLSVGPGTIPSLRTLTHTHLAEGSFPHKRGGGQRWGQGHPGNHRAAWLPLFFLVHFHRRQTVLNKGHCGRSTEGNPGD